MYKYYIYTLTTYIIVGIQMLQYQSATSSKLNQYSVMYIIK